MRRNLFYTVGLLLLAILIPSCGKDDTPPEPKHLELSQQTLEYTSAGGKATIELKSNTQWTVSNIPDWIAVSPKSGNGNATLTIDVSANTEYESRNGTLTITGVDVTGSLRKSITIRQGQSQTVIVDGNSATIGWQGGIVEIPFKYTSYPDITIDGNPGWIKERKPTKAFSNGTVSFDVEQNDGNQRTATITFSLDGSSETYTVTQEAYIPMQSISFNAESPLTIDSNGDYPLDVTISPVECSDKTLKWSSSNADVATISDNGIISAIANGETTITASSEDGSVSAELKVIIKIKAQSIAFVEWFEGNSFIPQGWVETTKIYGSWGYEYTPQFQIIPENAYIGDMELSTSDKSLVSVSGNKFVCNNDRRSGSAEISVSLPYSGVSDKVAMEVRGCYISAGLGHIEQGDTFFNIKFAGVLYTNNPTDEFKIEGISIVDENNQVVTFGGSYQGNGTNYVNWQTKDYVNLANYGLIVIDDDFYNRISKWKAIITYSNPKYQGNMQESINIDVHTQY